ncbi:hypothetical protein TNCV_3133931 [Trichonephila clavipes]|nr:hypothetical protein TNCV_3133931 [Trichonephila clavipes]
MLPQLANLELRRFSNLVDSSDADCHGWHRMWSDAGLRLSDDFSPTFVASRIGNNPANVVFQMVKRLWLIRIDQ